MPRWIIDLNPLSTQHTEANEQIASFYVLLNHFFPSFFDRFFLVFSRLMPLPCCCLVAKIINLDGNIIVKSTRKKYSWTQYRLGSMLRERKNLSSDLQLLTGLVALKFPASLRKKVFINETRDWKTFFCCINSMKNVAERKTLRFSNKKNRKKLRNVMIVNWAELLHQLTLVFRAVKFFFRTKNFT